MNAIKRDKKAEAKRRYSLNRKLVVAVLVIFALALTSGIASAATHVVNQTAPACTAANPDVPGNYYASIQAAVNAANPGDSIIVCPETTAYQETVDVNVSDINISAYNVTKPVVSADVQNDHVFRITNQRNVTLQGFEIRDARGTTQEVAGIYMDNASECNISNNFVTNISGILDAYGIYLLDSNNNSFSSSTNVSYVNATDYDAYGIYLEDSNNNSFSSSINVSNINAYYAYGILLEGSNNNSFSSSTNVSYVNATDYDAYGIYLWSSSNNSFSSSTTVSYVNATDYDAYGIYLWRSTNNSFSSTTNVSYVNATEDACGIYLGDSGNNTFSSSTNVSYVNP